MFKKGDKIVYGSSGVCTVVDIAPLDPGGKDYYTLKPEFGSEVIYTPVDTKVYMRAALTKEEAEELIRRIPQVEAKKCENMTVAAMRDEYQKSFANHDREDLIQLIKGIYQKGERSGKLGVIDEQFMKRAENLLYGEIATALGIEREQVVDYIIKTIEK